MNPYIDVFERLADSPNSRGVIQIPIHAELSDEMVAFTERVALLRGTPRELLEQSERRLDQKWREYQDRQRAAERSRGREAAVQ